MGRSKSIDPFVKDAVLAYPTVDLIRRLFPDVKMRGRSLLCNPLRGEKNASFSCFRDGNGVPRWKDHATGETGDNIEFFRMAFPEYSYPEAVDELSKILLGKEALVDSPARAVRRRRAELPPVKEEPGLLRVVWEGEARSGACPEELVTYWRSRGISDETAGRYFRMIVYENANLKGRTSLSPVTGLPVTDSTGGLVVDDGRREALGLPNAIGGWALRSPDTPDRKGFKGCTSSFPSIIFSDGSMAFPPFPFTGEGDRMVTLLNYNAMSGFLGINPAQGFLRVPEAVAIEVKPLLDTFIGQRLGGRDQAALGAVLGMVTRGPSSPVAIVVEGAFDALSYVEMQRMAGNGRQCRRQFAFVGVILSGGQLLGPPDGSHDVRQLRAIDRPVHIRSLLFPSAIYDCAYSISIWGPLQQHSHPVLTFGIVCAMMICVDEK